MNDKRDLGGPISFLYDELGCKWIYYYREGLLKLADDHSEYGGYYYSTFEEARLFLELTYGKQKKKS